LRYKLKMFWMRFWMRFAPIPVIGRITTRLALLCSKSYRHRYVLASFHPHGFTAPDADVCNCGFLRGRHAYIGSRVTIFRQPNAGHIQISDGVFLNDGIRFEAGSGGSIEIGEGTHIQPDCQFSAYVGDIIVGRNVQIAPRCAFYPYDHGTARNESMMKQPLTSKGGIIVKDEAWIGYGAIILDGVTIGTGAVVGAGSVVKDDVPDYAVSAGMPAKLIKMRT
jgi:acetyltransferase-like isoleucine patch superfamily enzyme